jgi:hypothetical protein
VTTIKDYKKIREFMNASFAEFQYLIIKQEKNSAIFYDKHGVARMIMPWEDYVAVQELTKDNVLQ